MDIEKTNLFQIRQAGLNILTRELGPVGLIKFLQQYETGTGDYSKERHQWLDQISIDDIQELIRIKRQKNK